VCMCMCACVFACWTAWGRVERQVCIGRGGNASLYSINIEDLLLMQSTLVSTKVSEHGGSNWYMTDLQLGFWGQPLGSRKRRPVFKTQPLGWNAWSGWCHWCGTSWPDPVRLSVSLENCTGEGSTLCHSETDHIAVWCMYMWYYIFLQGGHIKIHLNSDIPVQVDGEPWVQSPGDVVVLKSALKVKNRCIAVYLWHNIHKFRMR